MNLEKPIVACFGEVLWDIFPHGMRAGGAPFNVSYNLKKLGIDSRMISRVGNDDLGTTLLKQIDEWNIPLEECQVDNTLPTGTVQATIDEYNEAHYQITANVAWDNIACNEQTLDLVSKADAFVFGTLAARSKVSRNTLYRMLDIARFKVFDINLRPPFYDRELLMTLLAKADLVKTNKAELRDILAFFGKDYQSEEDSMAYLAEKFNLKEVLLTKGSRGAMQYGHQQFCHCDAIPITIKDTVGSGDSFLAGYLASKLSGGSVEEAMQNAAAMGAFITSQSGACPQYDLAAFNHFKESNLHAFLKKTA